MITGCATTSQQIMETEESQVKIRAMQTRVFDTNDKNLMMRNTISTLQDLEFVIENADLTFGTVTAKKYIHNSAVEATATVKEKGENQITVRLNARYGIKIVEDPEIYQDFFTALSKSIFLAANEID
jgi:hypothetical protein